MQPLRIFIGWDPKESVAFHVLSHSILTRASRPVAIIPLVQQQLRDAEIYTRARGPLESTEFSLTRFLVPYLSGYEGVSVYMDCDMLCLADIHELVAEPLRHVWPPDYEGPDTDAGETMPPAVWVCQHAYTPKTVTKMDGQQQTAYWRKNWSSLMVFDNTRCSVLTPEFVNETHGLDLHTLIAFGADEIGSLPLVWNWLVGEYPEQGHEVDCRAMGTLQGAEQGCDCSWQAKILHYTLGGPWHGLWESAVPWLDELWAMGIPPHSVIPAPSGLKGARS